MAYNCTMTPLSNTASTKSFRIVIFGGGTIMHVRNHVGLCAPAYGGTAKKLASMLQYTVTDRCLDLSIDLMLTKMADSESRMETNEDVEQALMRVVADPATAGIIFNVALCDFSGEIGSVASGKYAPRLQTREVTKNGLTMTLRPTKKLLKLIAAQRPDIVSVGFKTTADEPVEAQIAKSNRMSREANISWMLANDTVTRNNVVLRGSSLHGNTVADAYYNGNDRNEALRILAQQFLQAVTPNYTAR